MEEQGLGESGGEEKSNKINLSLHISLIKSEFGLKALLRLTDGCTASE